MSRIFFVKIYSYMRRHILLIAHFTIVVTADTHGRVNKVLCKQAIQLVFYCSIWEINIILRHRIQVAIQISFNELDIFAAIKYHLRKVEGRNSSVLSSCHLYIIKIIQGLIQTLQGHCNSKSLFPKELYQGLQQCFAF